jgi:hypothetical protein
MDRIDPWRRGSASSLHSVPDVDAIGAVLQTDRRQREGQSAFDNHIKPVAADA